MDNGYPDMIPYNH